MISNAANPSTSDLFALARPPFNLTPGEVEWVATTLARLSEDEQLGQLFNVMLGDASDAAARALARLHPGAITLAPWLSPEQRALAIETVREHGVVPPLVSADLEGGAITMSGMTPLTNQLGMAAMGDVDLYSRAMTVLAREGAAIGVNWTFAPVIDINAEFRSAIVGTRSFGSDIERVKELGLANIHAFQAQGLAACVKHWPGEGYDSRDQHLVTTINPLSMSEWRARFGMLYRSAIDAGVLSVMSAHIALPAYAREHGETGIELYRPASISPLLNKKLLREELGFNGVITSDATTMGGLTSWGPRERVLPEVIENGCDMVLFTRDMAADLVTMKQALADGRLSRARLGEALIRVLGLKAKLGRAAAAPDRSAPALSARDHHAIALETAQRSPTLVKNVGHLLPLSPDSHRHVLIIREPARLGFADAAAPPLIIDQLLSEAGFDVQTFTPNGGPPSFDADVVIYLLAQESLLTKSNIYLDWAAVQGPVEAAMQRSWHDVPTILLSFGHPYYLFDAPRVPCVVNAYSAVEEVQRAVVRKLLGREPFSGINPVDPFCGLDDARY